MDRGEIAAAADVNHARLHELLLALLVATKPMLDAVAPRQKMIWKIESDGISQRGSGLWVDDFVFLFINASLQWWELPDSWEFVDFIATWPSAVNVLFRGMDFLATDDRNHRRMIL